MDLVFIAGASRDFDNNVEYLGVHESLLSTKKYWGERRGSNPRHPGPQPGALPAELRPP